MGILHHWDIYPETIEKAWETAQEALETLYLEDEIDKLEELIKNSDIKDIIINDATNDIIKFIFENTIDIITDQYPNIKVDCTVNGNASSIDIDKDVINCIEALKRAGLEQDVYGRVHPLGTPIVRFLKSKMLEELGSEAVIEMTLEKYTFEDFLNSIEYGETVTMYGSIEELGEDNQDNGCREDDDTDESFGMFLIQAYHDAYSNEAYFEFNDGTVACIDLKEERI